jgi:hypothetical protein
MSTPLSFVIRISIAQPSGTCLPSWRNTRLALMESLRSSQDFLTYVPLTWFPGQGRSVRLSRNGAYVARSVFRAMALIVLTTICFFACVFLLFVLVKGMRETKRNATTRPVVDSKVSDKREEKREEKPPHALDSRRIVERRDRFKVGARRVPTAKERSGSCESWYDERERIAYDRIARSFRPGKRS